MSDLQIEAIRLQYENSLHCNNADEQRGSETTLNPRCGAHRLGRLSTVRGGDGGSGRRGLVRGSMSGRLVDDGMMGGSGVLRRSRMRRRGRLGARMRRNRACGAHDRYRRVESAIRIHSGFHVVLIILTACFSHGRQEGGVELRPLAQASSCMAFAACFLHFRFEDSLAALR